MFPWCEGCLCWRSVKETMETLAKLLYSSETKCHKWQEVCVPLSFLCQILPWLRWNHQADLTLADVRNLKNVNVFGECVLWGTPAAHACTQETGRKWRNDLLSQATRTHADVVWSCFVCILKCGGYFLSHPVLRIGTQVVFCFQSELMYRNLKSVYMIKFPSSLDLSDGSTKGCWEGLVLNEKKCFIE